MIALQHVYKSYPSKTSPVRVLSDISLTVRPGEKVGILGRNGAGKSTLIRLIGGVERPSSGNVVRKMSVSWPLAFGGAFQGSLTGLDNIRFIARVYGIDYKESLSFIEEFSELGRFLREPIKNYSAGMMARLAFGLSMAIEFDCFLIDEVIAVGDLKFQAKCNVELFEKRGDRAFIFVSHDPGFISAHCETGAVLSKGQLRRYQSIDEALDSYSQLNA